MPVLRANIKKGKFSNYGNSRFAKQTSNTQYFAQRTYKQPTMRGAFPKAVRFSLNDEGITNARFNYNRGLDLNRSAAQASSYSSNAATAAMSSATLANGIYGGTTPNKKLNIPFIGGAGNASYNGNAARRLNGMPKTMPAAKPAPQKKVQAVRGSASQRGIMQSSAMSPTLVTFAKFSAALVIFIALIAFVRVGLTSQTISKGIESQNITAQIDQELTTKNGLEVQASTLGNSSKVREGAEKLGMITPATIETIKLEKDVLAKNEDGSLSLVNSLDRLTDSAK